MSEDKDKGVIGTATDEAKGALVEAYRDLGRPVLAPVGQVAGGLVNLVLWPVKLALDSANAHLGKLAARVEAKLTAANVPPDRLLPAPATVAGHAALQYALLGDGDEVAELRELFENLLARAMHKDTTASVHPAFVGMLSQLTSDEARILKSITYRVNAAFDVNFIGEGELFIAHGLRTLLGTDIGIDEKRIPAYVSNLVRLEILRIEDRLNEEAYHSYEFVQNRIQSEFPEEKDPAVLGNIVPTPKALVVTEFGLSFLEACVDCKLVRRAR